LIWLAIGAAFCSAALAVTAAFFAVKAARELRRMEDNLRHALQLSDMYEGKMKEAWRKLYPASADLI
jgi:uncharacterized membrane protein YhiD involved in acid resistance